jgi:hypothetical protein
MQALSIVIGFVILVAGHQANWLYSAGITYLIITEFSPLMISPDKLLQTVIYSLVGGMSAALLTILVKKPMTILASLATGVLLGVHLPAILNIQSELPGWLVPSLLGTICALAVLIWGALPLIIITSLLGALTMSRSIPIGTVNPLIMFSLLTFIGLLTQWVLWQYNRPE